MTENEIGSQIVDAAVKIHRSMGPGLLEAVYEVILAHELRCRGKRLGYLLNFSEALMRNGIVRIANRLA
jgi:hypothetical protein